jgi:hypothetical protein
MKTRGRILRVKLGYNPNSSSIGTHINAFLLGTAAFTIAANLILAIVSSTLLPEKEKPGQLQKEK